MMYLLFSDVDKNLYIQWQNNSTQTVAKIVHQ